MENCARIFQSQAVWPRAVRRGGTRGRVGRGGGAFRGDRAVQTAKAGACGSKADAFGAKAHAFASKAYAFASKAHASASKAYASASKAYASAAKAHASAAKAHASAAKAHAFASKAYPSAAKAYASEAKADAFLAKGSGVCTNSRTTAVERFARRTLCVGFANTAPASRTTTRARSEAFHPSRATPCAAGR